MDCTFFLERQSLFLDNVHQGSVVCNSVTMVDEELHSCDNFYLILSTGHKSLQSVGLCS